MPDDPERRRTEKYYTFMEQCIKELTDEGMSEDEAESECELIWQEEEGDNATP